MAKMSLPRIWIDSQRQAFDARMDMYRILFVQVYEGGIRVPFLVS